MHLPGWIGCSSSAGVGDAAAAAAGAGCSCAGDECDVRRSRLATSVEPQIADQVG